MDIYSLQELRSRAPIASGGEVRFVQTGHTPIKISAGITNSGEYKVWADYFHMNSRIHVGEFSAGTGQSTHNSKDRAWKALVQKIETFVRSNPNYK